VIIASAPGFQLGIATTATEDTADSDVVFAAVVITVVLVSLILQVGVILFLILFMYVGICSADQQSL
jgi:hypothetical protein